MPSLAESLTAQFYAWERRGRGWQVHPYRVALEPAFVPYLRFAPAIGTVADDGRRPSIFQQLGSLFSRKPKPSDEGPTWEEILAAAEPEPDQGDDALLVLRLRTPSDADLPADLSEALLLALAGTASHVSVEFVAVRGEIVLQVAVPASVGSSARRIVEGYVPEADVSEGDALTAAWGDPGRREAAVVDFGLRNEFMLPLEMRGLHGVDPIVGVLAALEGVSRDEVACVQVMCEAIRPDWAVSALRAMSDGEGHAFFADAPETLGQTREKLSRPLLACVIRVAANAKSQERAWELVRTIGRALVGASVGGANALIPLEAEGYDRLDHELDVLSRRSCRSGMLLSSAEVGALAHLPGGDLRSEGLHADGGTTKTAPESLREGDVLLGENRHKGATVPVCLKTSDRLRHMHLIGATGTGKSTLLLSLIRQDIEAGRGVALLDPHGDLADEVLGLVPESRAGDVVLFDPADEEFPIGFNVLDAHSDRERELLSSDLVAVFRRFSTSWGDQMSAVLGNAVLAFLEHPSGGSLLDLRRFLSDRAVREAYLTGVSDPLVRSFWDDEFPRLTGRPQMPILTRLDAFLRPKAVRNVVSQEKSRFDLGALMDRGGIFVARLSQGAIGEVNAHLLGSLLVAQFQQTALARERQSQSERKPFFLYLDEFHHFITPSLASLLSGARKYGLGLVLAHQELRQLGEHDVRGAVLANAGVRVCFRVGDEDARTLAAGFRAFDSHALMSLGIGEAICRVGRADQDFNVRCPVPARGDSSVAARRAEAIRSQSRARYSEIRSVVEAAIAAKYVRSEEPAPSVHVTRPRAVPSTPVESARAPSPAPGSAPPPSVVADTPEPRRPRVARTLPGKGGVEHKYLQSLIKSYAESKGFRATIEAEVDGGQIDVLLQRDTLRIACEISVTTDAEHEVGNVRKCLAAGVARVLVVSSSATALKKLEQGLTQALAPGEQAQVSYVSPQGVIAMLDEHGSSAEPEATSVLGYRVKTSVRGGRPGSGARSQAVAKTIVDALRRLKGK